MQTKQKHKVAALKGILMSKENSLSWNRKGKTNCFKSCKRKIVQINSQLAPFPCGRFIFTNLSVLKERWHFDLGNFVLS